MLEGAAIAHVAEKANAVEKGRMEYNTKRLKFFQVRFISFFMREGK